MAACAGLARICFSGPGGGGTGIKEMPHMCAATCLRTLHLQPSCSPLHSQPGLCKLLATPTPSSISEVSPKVPCASTETLL